MSTAWRLTKSTGQIEARSVLEGVVSQSVPTIVRGVCHVFFAWDVGASIDTDACSRLLRSAPTRRSLSSRHPGPTSPYRSAPLSVSRSTAPVSVGGWTTVPEIEIVVHDFGVVSLGYRIELDGSLESLVALAGSLYDNAALRADSRRVVDAFLAEIRRSVRNASLFDECEDYVVYEIAVMAPALPMDRLLAEQGELIARVLRSESHPLSSDEVTDAHACRLSYGLDDLVLVDWNAAMLFDRDAHDSRAVLEFANLELLELRLLDRQLDEALSASHRALRNPFPWLGWPGAARRGAGRVAQFQVEGAVLFEEINNTLKLLGDQYLARLYRLASQRLHLNDWDAGVLRKLDTLESIYQKLADRASSRRMELLEWIIIVLITISIVLPFLPFGGAH